MIQSAVIESRRRPQYNNQEKQGLAGNLFAESVSNVTAVVEMVHLTARMAEGMAIALPADKEAHLNRRAVSSNTMSS